MPSLKRSRERRAARVRVVSERVLQLFGVRWIRNALQSLHSASVARHAGTPVVTAVEKNVAILAMDAQAARRARRRGGPRVRRVRGFALGG